MFIRKGRYEALIKALEELNKENDMLASNKRSVEISRDFYKEEYKKLKEAVESLEKRNETLELSVHDLATENMKLVEWINKVISDLGCYEVSKRSVQIPIVNKEYAIGQGPLGQSVYGKRVVIPEITFLKTERR